MTESPAEPGRAIVLYGAVPPGAPPDELDVLDEVRVVSAALERLGWQPEPLALTIDLEAARSRLAARPPEVVFNLVETLEGQGRKAALAPKLLEELGLPFTGTPSAAMLISSGKLLTKQALAAAGVASPPAWIHGSATAPDASEWPGRWIVKSCWEHASIGIDDASVVEASRVPEEVERRRRGGGDWFAEGYVEGREFNLTVLGNGRRPEVLPPAEIDFLDYPAGKPRIVGYPAKWDPASFEFNHSPRRFEFPAADRELLDRLARIAGASWSAIGLAGYARVDFRVDAAGTPWVVDVNANPCLSPDSGFVATAERSGIDFDRLIAKIVESAIPSAERLSTAGPPGRGPGRRCTGRRRRP